ncbi:hypothetical protein F5878DRAFT_666038 [Lentinula raphanica]|uniref:Uncharacterized protein n=1 Tax=Lentinula raphanica TaxID=153919 RepID=A0AA38NYJ8_9AGAR|nr:hypothetical protein F5878DRAFT_666038 [Lentinula raphanica]
MAREEEDLLLPEESADLLQELEEENDLFHFVRVEKEPEIGEAGPGPGTLAQRNALLERQLGAKLRTFDDTEEVEKVIEENEEAGHIIRMDHSLEARWRLAHNLDVDHPMDGSSSLPDKAFAPFASEMDWRIAEWVVKDGIGHKSFDRLLAIPGVKEKLPRAGEWKTRKLRFKDDESSNDFILRHRDILECVQSLWGDPALADHLVYKPKKIFQDAGKTKRVYSEMWEGKWWQFTQDLLPKGSTVAPLIIATDKTQLTQFSGSKQAYPVYLTLGNIPKALRRKPSQQVCILLAYLPVDKMPKDGLPKRELSSRYQRLFHEAMRLIFSPLREAGRKGVEMVGGDGAVRLVHPILASYVADFPEQCLVTCSKYGTCPKCRVAAAELSSSSSFPRRTKDWTLQVMEEARRSSSSDAQYFAYCMRKEVSGYTFRPFWDDLPFTDIHFSITPDVLHQLYQGVLKHLISWCQDILGSSELDRRIPSLPPSFGVRHFKNGISALSQISGTERKNMGKILLGCLVGSDMPRDALTAVRSILDFLYLAQYSTHDDDTLSYMADALNLWHAKKSSFVDLAVHDDLNIPKFHTLQHYVEMIRFFGCTDNYNTEMFERLHIDYAKKGWRASNKREEFPQMTKWLVRQENIQSFNKELSWVIEQQRLQLLQKKQDSIPVSTPPSTTTLLLPKEPTAPSKALSLIESGHRVPMFASNLRRYLAMLKPGSSRAEVEGGLVKSLPFNALDVYYSFKFSPETLDDDSSIKDVVKATPLKGGRFDTVVILTGDSAETASFTGTRIGRVKVIFHLPSQLTLIGTYKSPSPSWWPTSVLAYVEWYSAPSQTPLEQKSHNMTTVHKLPLIEGITPWSIVPLSNIRQSCMLMPRYDKQNLDRATWTSSNVLDKATHFLVNNWSSLYTYKTLYKD